MWFVMYLFVPGFECVLNFGSTLVNLCSMNADNFAHSAYNFICAWGYKFNNNHDE